MDHNTFDALTRNLASSGSRRSLLARLTMGALAALPLTLAGDDAEARPCPPCRAKRKGTCKRKRPNGTSCGECRECQNGRCDVLPEGVSCGTGKSCQRGVCAACDPGNTPCTPGQDHTCCSGKCSMANLNLFHCEPHG